MAVCFAGLFPLSAHACMGCFAHRGKIMIRVMRAPARLVHHERVYVAVRPHAAARTGGAFTGHLLDAVGANKHRRKRVFDDAGLMAAQLRTMLAAVG